MENSDQQLINDYIDGNEGAFEELVSRYLKTVYRYVYRMVGGDDEAQDLTQAVFVKVWKKLDKYDQRQNFKTWILSIARNTTIDWFRKKKAISFSSLEKEDDDSSFADNLADVEPLPDHLFEQKELAALLAAAMNSLPINYRTVLTLHLEDDLTFEEIAQIVDRPMNTVKSQYRRGLQGLRKFLDNAPK